MVYSGNLYLQRFRALSSGSCNIYSRTPMTSNTRTVSAECRICLPYLGQIYQNHIGLKSSLFSVTKLLGAPGAFKRKRPRSAGMYIERQHKLPHSEIWQHKNQDFNTEKSLYLFIFWEFIFTICIEILLTVRQTCQPQPL